MAKGFSKPQRLELLNLIADLYLKGNSMRWMSEEVERLGYGKITSQTVFNYVKRLRAEWLKERVDKIDELKTIELQRINKLEIEYWNAWERSMTGKQKTVDKKVKGSPGSIVNEQGTIVDTQGFITDEQNVTTENTNGDPRYLSGVQWCIQMRCKILGIEAPVEFKNVGTEMKRSIVIKIKDRQKFE